MRSDDPNLQITVTPNDIKLRPGQSLTFQVDVDTSLVADDEWKFGAVVWSTKKKDGPEGPRAPDAYLPVAVFAAASSDPSQLTKTVDKTEAAEGETLTYDIALSNLTLTDPIDLVDAIPAGSTFVPGSESAIVNGVPDPSFTYDAGSNSLTWSGVLDTQTLELVPGLTPFGYVPLNLFFAPLTCSSVCDDTSITLSGFSPFMFAGASYDSVVMSSNGFVVAGGDASGAFTPFNQNMPDAAAPNNVIAPLWTDLDLDGTSPTDSGAGDLYAGLLSGGGSTYLVLEWQNAELFGLPGSAYTAQVWFELGTSNISVVYASLVPGIPAFLTVGVEDADGSAGSSRYYNGAGTPPALGIGGELQVDAQPGGTAQFNFEVEVDCGLDPVVNVVEVTSGSASLKALAATEVVPGGSCD